MLDRHGLTLDPVTGEVVELQPFNAVMSKRGEQVRQNLERLEAEWEAAHPGESIGPVGRHPADGGGVGASSGPRRSPPRSREEAAWVTELARPDTTPTTLHRPAPRAPCSGSMTCRVQEVASRALDRCAAAASAWTAHTVQEHATRIITEYGVRATPDGVARLHRGCNAAGVGGLLLDPPTRRTAHRSMWRI